MCFGFLVIEINAKQCSGMTIKPSMKPTWECRQGKEIMVRSSQKPCANKSCYFEPFTFRYLTSKNHLHYLSILGPCLLSPPPSVIPPKSRSCFSKQTMTVCTLSLELKMFLENGKQMLHCQFVRNSREEIKLLDQWVCATTVNRTRSFTGPLYLNRKPLAGAIILPTGETITCYFVVYKFVEHRACCQAASPCITNPAPAQEPLACSELVWGFVFAEEGVCSRFFSGPRFPWHTFGPNKVTVCPPPSHQGVLFPTWWETGFVAVRLPLFLAIVLFFPPEMEISGLMTAPRWRSGRWWSGCRVVL